MSESEIKYLFEPRSVAVIGVSHNPSKVGYKILENILVGGYRGKVFPINRQGGKILGLAVYKSILEIKETIDVGIISVPAGDVYQELEKWPEKKVKFLIIVASGFSEVGNIDEERRVIALTKKKGIRVLGPNVFGIYSSAASLNATFGAKVKAQPGNLAIISQSGALGIALMGKAQTEKIGLSTIVFEGNKADINGKDLLPYFISDQQTKAVFIYLEGVKNGGELMPILKQLSAKKPVVVLKAGVSEKGKIAANSHTGSLAGEARIFSAAVKQCGVIQAESLKQAINWSKFLIRAPLPKGENVLIITNGGGMGILATDLCEKYGLSLFNGEEKLKKTFSSIVPSFGSLKNPVDITGMAGAEDYRLALKAALEEPDIHSIICLGCETAVLDNSQLAKIFMDIFTKAGKPVSFAFVGGEEVRERLLSLREKGLPIFDEVKEAVTCLGSLYQRFRYLKRETAQSKHGEINSLVVGKIKKLIKGEELGKRVSVSADKAREIVKLIKVPIPKTLLAINEKQTIQFAEKICFPVVMKIVSPDIAHKTDSGGVILNLKDKGEVVKAYSLLKQNYKRNYPKVKIEGVEIGEMVNEGLEVIVGAKKDRDFGTVVMFGLGGIYTEVLKDIAFRVFPCSIREVEEMVEEIKSYPLLLGVRGEGKKDIKAVIETIIKLGQVVQNCEQITEIEINPLKVFSAGRGVKALDVRILLKKGF